MEYDWELPGIILALLEEVIGQKELLDASDHAFLKLIHYGLSYDLGQLIRIPRYSQTVRCEVRLADHAEAGCVTLQDRRPQPIKCVGHGPLELLILLCVVEAAQCTGQSLVRPEWIQKWLLLHLLFKFKLFYIAFICEGIYY